METTTISNLRANITQILKEVYFGKIINITSKGKIIAKIISPDNHIENAKKELEEISKTAIIHDIVSPVNETWKQGNRL